MKERIMVMENQEGGETGRDDWFVEAKEQVDDIRRNAQEAANVNPKVTAAIEHGRVWQRAWQGAFDKYYDLGLKAFASGNPEDAKRYAQEWEQFIQDHPEVASLSRSEQNTWLIKNNIPIEQGDALLTSREMSKAVQIAEGTPSPGAGGGEGQPPGEGPPAPPAGPEGEQPEETELPGGPEQQTVRVPIELQPRLSDDPLEGILVPTEIREPGLPAVILWPVTREGRLYKLSKLFNELERTTDPDGGPGFAARYKELEAVITSLILNPQNPGDKETGLEMRQIEKARLAFHVTFLGYKNAGDIKEVANVANKLLADQLKWAFVRPEIIETLQYYEDNGRRFVEATKDFNKIENFRLEVVRYLIGTGTVGQVTNDEIEKLTRESKITPEQAMEVISGRINNDAVAAQNLAERIWQITGRLAMHDIAVKGENGTWKFIGGGIAETGGNFVMRRLLRCTDWLKTQEPGIKVFTEIMRGINLETPDWFEFVAADNLSRHVVLTEEEESQIRGLPDDKMLEFKSNKFFTSAEEEIEAGITHKMTKVNFKTVNWQEVNFQDIAEKPMDFWSFRKLTQPEDTRAALAKDANALLSNPTPDALFAIKDAFRYLTDKQWSVKLTLLKNIAEFMRKDNIRKLGRPNASFEAIDKMIQDAVSQNYLTVEQRGQAEKEVLGWWRYPARASYIFNPLEFILGLLSSIWEEVKKTVTAR